MNDLLSVVDWSRAQFALTAMYHWLFVPLTLGLSVIVGIMETIYLRTGDKKWLNTTKFWMSIFGINFAVGVATGIILEFEFGTNWSNYSWFVGDIFGAPLAIEGLLAFFMEATFIAIMFFGWNKVSKRAHLAATWLTALGTTLSAFWILVANAWMQYPVGMEFDPAQMRNVMDNFWAVAFSPMAINKFFHTIFSGWALGGIMVMGICGWFLLKKSNIDMAIRSTKVGIWVAFVGMLLTMAFGHGSAQLVSKTQPMKLAAMEGLYNGEQGTEFVAFGLLNSQDNIKNGENPFIFKIGIPNMLSFLCNSDFNSFVPGINDIISGKSYDSDNSEISSVSYSERIKIGKTAHEALREYDKAFVAHDEAAMAQANNKLKENFKYFGYGYLDSPEEAVPNVPITFYSFHLMIILGCYLFALIILTGFFVYRTDVMQKSKLMQWLVILAIPVVWVCSESGWVTAEVGRQPWIIQDLMPAKAAISAITAGQVQTTFWIFAVLFTGFLIAEVGILINFIRKQSKLNIDNL